eukprot:jgi/Hompol1/6565/HPOL_001312-RA
MSAIRSDDGTDAGSPTPPLAASQSASKPVSKHVSKPASSELSPQLLEPHDCSGPPGLPDLWLWLRPRLQSFAVASESSHSAERPRAPSLSIPSLNIPSLDLAELSGGPLVGALDIHASTSLSIPPSPPASPKPVPATAAGIPSPSKANAIHTLAADLRFALAPAEATVLASRQWDTIACRTEAEAAAKRGSLIIAESLSKPPSPSRMHSALAHFEAAAALGDSVAAFNAAVLLERLARAGSSCVVDSTAEARAIVLYRQAAYDGLALAQFYLSVALLRRIMEISKGGRVDNMGSKLAQQIHAIADQDRAEAIKWIQRAADQGVANARALLMLIKAVEPMNGVSADGASIEIDDLQVSASIKDLVSFCIALSNDASSKSASKPATNELRTVCQAAARAGSFLAAYNAGVLAEQQGDLVDACKCPFSAYSKLKSENKN